MPRDILLRVGGRALTRYGVPLVAGSGIGRTEAGKEVFVRADAAPVARYIERGDRTLVAAAGVLRNERVDLDGDGVRESAALLLEPLRQQVWDRASEFAHANWTKSNCTISTDNQAAPDGTPAACDNLVESTDGGATTHGLWRALTGAADNTRQSFFYVVRGGTRGWCLIQGTKKTGATAWAYVNLTTGAIGATSLGGNDSVRVYGRLYSGLASGIPFWVVAMTVDVGTGATTPLGQLFSANGDNAVAYQGNGGHALSVWLGQFELDKAIETSPIMSSASGNVQRNADGFSAPLSVGRTVLSLYVDVLERAAFFSGHDGRLITLGASTFSAPYFALQSFQTSGYRGILDVGSGLVSTGFHPPVAFGSRVRWVVRMVVVSVDGAGVPTVKLQSEMRVGSGAILTVADSATTALTPGSWSAQTFWLGAGNGTGVAAADPRAYLDAMLLNGPFGLVDCEAVP